MDEIAFKFIHMEHAEELAGEILNVLANKFADLIAQKNKSGLINIASSVHVPFRGSEIYLLYKSFIDSGGAPAETYKSLFEKTGRHLANKNQKGFSTESLQKCSDKVDYEARENVKRFLQKMIRNIDSY